MQQISSRQVRVFRGSKAAGKIIYTYEGLYKVTEAITAVRMERRLMET